MRGIEDEFIEILKQVLSPNVKKISEVDWSTVSQEALDNNTFKVGEPFFLVAPADYWQTMRDSPAYRSRCRCLDVNNNPIPGCTPPSRLFPVAFSICINIADNTYNDKSGRNCTRLGDSWYQLTCYCPCL